MSNELRDAKDALIHTINTRKYLSWDIIVTGTNKICQNCKSFNPENCSYCSDYMELVYTMAPTMDHGTDYLIELDKFNKEELADCFTLEDYEKE